MPLWSTFSLYFLEGRRDGVRLPGLKKQQVVAGAYLVECVVHMKFLCNPVKVLRGSHIGHGMFSPRSGSSALPRSGGPLGVSAFRWWAFAARTTFEKAAASTFPVSFEARIERAIVLWLTSSCIRPPFRQGSRRTGGPLACAGSRKPRADMARGLTLGIFGRSLLRGLRLHFFALFPHGL